MWLPWRQGGKTNSGMMAACFLANIQSKKTLDCFFSHRRFEKQADNNKLIFLKNRMTTLQQRGINWAFIVEKLYLPNKH